MIINKRIQTQPNNFYFLAFSKVSLPFSLSLYRSRQFIRLFLCSFHSVFGAEPTCSQSVCCYVCAWDDVSVFVLPCCCHCHYRCCLPSPSPSPSPPPKSFSCCIILWFQSTHNIIPAMWMRQTYIADRDVVVVCVYVVRQVSKHTDTCTMHNAVASEWAIHMFSEYECTMKLALAFGFSL